MPFQGLPDGLYLAKRPALSVKVVEHYGVIDIGNRLGYPLPPQTGDNPVVVHQCAEGLKAEFLSGTWNVELRIEDESGATARIQTAMATPNYDLFGNNCEHFARFVANGVRESKQLQAAAIVSLAAFAIWGLSGEDAG